MQKLVYFNSRYSLVRIDIAQIAFFEGDGNYTYIVTTNKMRTCLTMNLSHIEDALAAQLGEQAKRFMRIGKRYIVNMDFIYQVDIQKQQLTLSDYNRFVFHLAISKEALKSVKELVIKTKI